MATSYSPVVPKGLKHYFDINDRNCVDAPNTSIVGNLQGTSTKLNCLVSDLQMEAYDNTNTNMTFTQDKSGYCYDQVGTNGGEPGWRSTTNVSRVDDYTFICWFKFNYGLDYQRAENIYGGGFNAQTSFVISWGGTSSSHGYLRYSEAGGTNSYNQASSYGGNDGNWHMFATTDTGGDGANTTTFYLDGISKGSTNSNGSHDTPDTAKQLTWGSWSVTYGNMGGRTNCFMYYDRVLSSSEILQIYNQMKGRFQ